MSQATLGERFLGVVQDSYRRYAERGPRSNA